MNANKNVTQQDLFKNAINKGLNASSRQINTTHNPKIEQFGPHKYVTGIYGSQGGKTYETMSPIEILAFYQNNNKTLPPRSNPDSGKYYFRDYDNPSPREMGAFLDFNKDVSDKNLAMYFNVHCNNYENIQMGIFQELDVESSFLDSNYKRMMDSRDVNKSNIFKDQRSTWFNVEKRDVSHFDWDGTGSAKKNIIKDPPPKKEPKVEKPKIEEPKKIAENIIKQTPTEAPKQPQQLLLNAPPVEEKPMPKVIENKKPIQKVDDGVWKKKPLAPTGYEYNNSFKKTVPLTADHNPVISLGNTRVNEGHIFKQQASTKIEPNKEFINSLVNRPKQGNPKVDASIWDGFAEKKQKYYNERPEAKALQETKAKEFRSIQDMKSKYSGNVNYDNNRISMNQSQKTVSSNYNKTIDSRPQNARSLFHKSITIGDTVKQPSSQNISYKPNSYNFDSNFVKNAVNNLDNEALKKALLKNLKKL